ncbi:uncharacterized protein F5147DRAFT_778206 [Suillus discolor]|uniref:Uncharacterized protein n=1 Tax=Suillus discolor TaxID=1912936 RepID=A0A9P7EYV3_9AGAM|nr:uncharacterized protein F5147DRAFT_778206 [Suillus discolor]KAG2096694.1 hypothetical protein F5147DRAFT_778206 [Suillus discolor]
MASKKWARPFPVCAAVGPAGTYTSADDGIAAHTAASPDDQDSVVYLTKIQLRKVTVIICERSAPIPFWKHPPVGSDAVTILASTAADIIIVASEVDFIAALEDGLDDAPCY